VATADVLYLVSCLITVFSSLIQVDVPFDRQCITNIFTKPV
jgi:hypothetical protein